MSGVGGRAMEMEILVLVEGCPERHSQEILEKFFGSLRRPILQLVECTLNNKMTVAHEDDRRSWNKAWETFSWFTSWHHRFFSTADAALPASPALWHFFHVFVFSCFHFVSRLCFTTRHCIVFIYCSILSSSGVAEKNAIPQFLAALGLWASWNPFAATHLIANSHLILN